MIDSQEGPKSNKQLSYKWRHMFVNTKNMEIIINIFSWHKKIKKIMGACVAKEKEGGNVRRKNNNCILLVKIN